MPDPGDLPPLDPELGLTPYRFDDGDQIEIYIFAPGEALDTNYQLAERGATSLPGAWTDSPDEVHVAEDGRPIAVYYSTAARQLIKRKPTDSLRSARAVTQLTAPRKNGLLT